MRKFKSPITNIMVKANYELPTSVAFDTTTQFINDFFERKCVEAGLFASDEEFEMFSAFALDKTLENHEAREIYSKHLSAEQIMKIETDPRVQWLTESLLPFQDPMRVVFDTDHVFYSENKDNDGLIKFDSGIRKYLKILSEHAQVEPGELEFQLQTELNKKIGETREKFNELCKKMNSGRMKDSFKDYDIYLNLMNKYNQLEKIRESESNEKKEAEIIPIDRGSRK